MIRKIMALYKWGRPLSAHWFVWKLTPVSHGWLANRVWSDRGLLTTMAWNDCHEAMIVRIPLVICCLIRNKPAKQAAGAD